MYFISPSISQIILLECVVKITSMSYFTPVCWLSRAMCMCTSQTLLQCTVVCGHQTGKHRSELLTHWQESEEANSWCPLYPALSSVTSPISPQSQARASSVQTPPRNVKHQIMQDYKLQELHLWSSKALLEAVWQREGPVVALDEWHTCYFPAGPKVSY